MASASCKRMAFCVYNRITLCRKGKVIILRWGTNKSKDEVPWPAAEGAPNDEVLGRRSVMLEAKTKTINDDLSGAPPLDPPK